MMGAMDQTRRATRRHQHGEINLSRLITIGAIFVAILLVPLHFLKDKTKLHKSRAPAASAPVAEKP